ncbi:MAG: C25 family cysteine peptidase [Candidatus Eisenbacteria bacterium]
MARFLRTLAAFAVLHSVLVCTSLFAALGAGIEVLQSDETGITLRVQVDSFTVRAVSHGGRTFHYVEIPGFFSTEEEGLPQLPYTAALIAVPFDVSPAVTVVENVTSSRTGVLPMPCPRAIIRGGEGDELPTPAHEFAIDESFYAGSASFPDRTAELSAPSFLRHQRVVSVHIFPFQYAPASRELVYSRTLLVRIDFRRTPGYRETDFEPAPSFEPNAEGMYEGVLINYETAKRWRMKPVSRAGESILPVAQVSNEFKIVVDSTGLYKVPFSSIPGLSGLYLPTKVRLFEKYYEEGATPPFKQRNVPIRIVDQNDDGYFGSTDYFVFYGLSMHDRFPLDPLECRYTKDNVYWLTVGGEDGLRMNERDSWRTAPAPLKPDSFLCVEKYEKDRVYLNVPPREAMDYYFWKQHYEYDTSEPFNVWAPDTTKAWRVRARYQGAISSLHIITMIIQNSRGLVDTLFYRDTLGTSYGNSKVEVTMDTGFTVPDWLLASGNNTFRYIGEHGVFGSFVQGSGACLDWFEISYYKKYVAGAGKLAFNSGGLTGELEMTLSRFPSQDLLLFDLSDSLNPVSLRIEGWQVTPEAGGYRLAFHDSVGTALRPYEAVAASALRPVTRILLDSPSSLASSGASKDYFIVSYDDFVPLLSPLIAHRQAFGHNVETARLSDVFDEFNGGIRSARAIKRYMKYGFSTWGTPLFLLLVGDASEDYKGHLATSDPDLVPTYLILSPVSTVSGRELVASDHWYVTGLEGVEDDYPDMYLGRIPAGSGQELTTFIQKIIAYEAFQPGQDFRAKGLLLADDNYSPPGSDPMKLCSTPSEDVFEETSNQVRNLIGASTALPGFGTDALFLRTLVDSFPSYPKPSCTDYLATLEYTRARVTPRVLSELSKGHLFVNYQGHGNRFLLAHEQLLRSDPYTNDVASVNNYGKPFFFLAFACHVADFDRADEKNFGDCLPEKLLAAPGRGAIGAFASNAFENLPFNYQGDMDFSIFDAFFGYNPTSDLKGKRGVRWLLGEVIASAKIRFLAGASTNKPSVKTYVLLADPGLRMDALPPQFSVLVNGSPFTNGSSLYVTTPVDSVRMAAYLNDEIGIVESSIRINETGSEGRGAIPPGEFYVRALSDTVVGTSKKFYVYFPTVLRAGTYDMVVSAADVNGRETSFVLKVQLNASFTADGTPLRDGSLVPSSFTLETVVTSPVVLTAEEVVLVVDDSTAVSSSEQVDAHGRVWRLTAPVVLRDGDHVLSVRVNGILRSVSVSVSSGFSMRDVFAYPNPFENVTSFNYRLTGTPAGVLIEMFTVSGRKILELEGTIRVGDNALVWNGRDSEGVRVANGIYIYRITATDVDGRKLSQLLKVVKAE